MGGLKVILGSIVVILLWSSCNGEEDGLPEKDYIYNSIYTTMIGAPCVRLLDISGEHGCGSHEDGSAGVLEYIEKLLQLEAFLSRSEAGDDRVILLDDHILSGANLDRLARDSSVKGVLVLVSGEKAEEWSADQHYPNAKFGLYSDTTHVWNPPGDNSLNTSFPFPMFAIYEPEEQAFLRDRAQRNEAGEGVPWAAELQSFMYGSQDSEVCIRRGHCEPLGGQSVWSTFSKPSSDKHTVMLLSASDSTALFHDLAVGAEAEMSGLVSLMGAVDALYSSSIKHEDLEKQIVFAFLTGEAYDFLGSRAFVKDLTNFTCTKPTNQGESCEVPYKNSLQFTNLSFANIDSIIEMKQVGLPSVNELNVSSYYIHQSNSGNSIADALDDVADGTQIAFEPLDEKLGIMCRIC